MKAILTEAADVGDATARALAYRTRLTDAYFYPDSAWCTPFIGGSYLFERDGVRLLDARSFMFFYATGITPAMAIQMVGAGSAYAGAFVDANNQPLDGARHYRLHLPPKIPARASGRSCSMTTRRGRCCRPTTRTPASAARSAVCRSTPTPRSISTSDRHPQPVTRPTRSDLARQGLECHPAPLRAAAAVV